MSMLSRWHGRIMAQAAVIVVFHTVMVGCAMHREVTPEPTQHTRSLPMTVQKAAWPAIVKTILLEGEVIQSAQQPLSRITFNRGVTAENVRELCDVTTMRSVDADSWTFEAGAIEIAIWLEEAPPDATEVQLTMEGRCQATFSPPKARGWLFAPMGPLVIPVMIFTAGRAGEWAAGRHAVVLASTGKLERDLQEKILTTLGVDLPPWLIDRQ